MNTDYCYCTGRYDESGESCPLRAECKRYSQVALEADTPFWWTDGFYDWHAGKCDFIDKRTK